MKEGATSIVCCLHMNFKTWSYVARSYIEPTLLNGETTVTVPRRYNIRFCMKRMYSSGANLNQWNDYPEFSDSTILASSEKSINPESAPYMETKRRPSTGSEP
jgi:hypothetical protein